MLMTIFYLLLSIALMLLGAALFTNGIEWFGKRINVSHGAVGSIFAGVGTALPETMIPVIAILFGNSAAERDVGIGAIIGAPFMLSTLTLPLLGVGLLTFSVFRKRSPSFRLDYAHVRQDLRFFLCAYTLAVLVALFPHPALRYGLALWLVIVYVYYLKTILAQGEHSGEDPSPLYFFRRTGQVPYGAIFVQIGTGLGLIIGAAHFFVHQVTEVSLFLGISPLILSLLITPVATELPEKLNSLIWIYQKKDTLAVGNITGAMVFQGTFPVSIGLVGTSWELNHFALTSAVLALVASFVFYALLKVQGQWKPMVIAAGVIFYMAFGVYLKLV